MRFKSKDMPNWQAHLGLDPGNSDIVEEPIGSLQSKRLFFTKEWKDAAPGAKGDPNLAVSVL